MATRKTENDWINIIREATVAPMSQRQWCLAHGISPNIYFVMKGRYQKKGSLPKSTPAEFLYAGETCLSFQDDVHGLTHMRPQCISPASLSAMLAYIRYDMQKDPYCGERFLFLSQDHKTVYALQWVGIGFRRSKVRKEKGTVCWPDGRFFSAQMLQEIQRMIS